MSPIRTMAIGLAGLLAATLATDASAAGSRVTVTKIGEVASLADFAKSSANLEALNTTRGKQPPIHLMPNGQRRTAQPAAGSLPSQGPQNVHLNAPSTVSSFAFNGMSFQTNVNDGIGILEPSDMGLAANNNQILQAVNTSLQGFQNSNGNVTTIISPVSLYAFFQIPMTGGLFGPDYFIFDPQVIFDNYGGRFIVTAGISDNNITNGFLVAISKTSDATKGYFLYLVSAALGVPQCIPNNCLADFPKVGYDQNGLYFTADLFSADGFGPFVGAAIYALPKGPMEAGTNNAFQLNAFGIVDSLDFVIVPSIPAVGEPPVTANGGTMYFQTARNIVDGSSNIRTFAVYNTIQLNPGGNPVLMMVAASDEAAPQYNSTVFMTQPQNASPAVGPFCASFGLTAPPLLDGGYDSLAPNVVLAGGNLFGAITTGARDGNGLLVNQILIELTHPTPGSFNPPTLGTGVVAASYVSAGNGNSLAYPAWALKKDSSSQLGASGVLGMDIVGNATPIFPGALSIALSGNPLSASVADVTGGVVSDGFTCLSGAERWGDYTAAAADPTINGVFYTSGGYTPSGLTQGLGANWGTAIIATTGVP